MGIPQRKATDRPPVFDQPGTLLIDQGEPPAGGRRRPGTRRGCQSIAVTLANEYRKSGDGANGRFRSNSDPRLADMFHGGLISLENYYFYFIFILDMRSGGQSHS